MLNLDVTSSYFPVTLQVLKSTPQGDLEVCELSFGDIIDEYLSAMCKLSRFEF